MTLLETWRGKVSRWPYNRITLLASVSAFACYTSMYAFRKAFTAGTYDDQQFFGVDYKVWLIIAQVLGYTFSKFYGIRFIAESNRNTRARSILFLIGMSWLALLGFALVPAPWNIVFLFLNGCPLGMIWGLVFSYLEGRKHTELMAAVMSVSMVFASGFVKTIGRRLLDGLHVDQYWMPFLMGLIFALPLVFTVACLEIVPPPTEEDQLLRTKREPMNAEERRLFVQNFLPGIIFTVITYVFMTVLRDMRDNFEVEIWADMGITDSGIYTKMDTFISIVILILISTLIFIKNNLKAFTYIHYMIILGCILAGAGTALFHAGYLSPIQWMALVGVGLYMGYIPYNAIFFERMIATFRHKGNVGFVMYIADAIGYLGSISVLFFKEFTNPEMSWGDFFRQGLFGLAVVGGVSSLLSLIWFRRKALQEKNSPVKLSEI